MVTALNLFHPTASPPFRKLGSFHITTQLHSAGLPGNHLYDRYNIVPLDPAYPAKTGWGHAPVNVGNQATDFLVGV